jgi:hypothetical protein
VPAEPDLPEKGNRKLHWYLMHISNCVGSEGYSVGKQPSLADGYLYAKLGETAPEAGARGAIMGDTAKVRAVLTKFPKVGAVVQTFGSSAGMKKWLEMRGPQKF